MNRLKTVLVLCTGNSCRSPMGEAILNHDLAGRVRAISAGATPRPHIVEEVISALTLAGIPTEDLHPKGIEAVADEPVDLVVRVCDAEASCPLFPRPTQHLQLAFHDPHDGGLDSFVALRDDMRARLVPAVCAALDIPLPERNAR